MESKSLDKYVFEALEEQIEYSIYGQNQTNEV